MGIFTWTVEHHPQARMNRVIYDMQQAESDGSMRGFKSLAHETSGFMLDAVTVGAAIVTRGASITSQSSQVNFVLGQGIFYDPGEIDVSSYGATGYYMLKLQQEQSLRQDTLTSTPGVQVPKTRSGTKSSRAAGAAQTLKPFWSDGLPKCRKGYRYDFKRKMCVKKS